MNVHEYARYLATHPAELARRIGFPDFKDDLQGEWARMLLDEQGGDQTLQAHRGSFKTTTLEVGIALYMIFHDDRNIIFLRKTDTDVSEVIKGVARILQTPLFRQMYAELTNGYDIQMTRCTASEIGTNVYSAPRGAAQLLGIGIGGSLTGKHADLVITDDIVNIKDRLSAAERERTKLTYMELQNVRNRGGRLFNTGTPWHKDDAFSIMPKAKRWDCYSTGLIDAAKLEQLRQSMTPSLFAANYELKHIAAENALFTDSARFTSDTNALRDGIAHIDAAYGGEDYTALTIGKRHGETLYLYGRLWRSHVDTVLDTALHDAARLMCSPVYCETNGDKGYLGKEIQRRGYQTHLYRETANKYTKISTYLRKWWKNIVWLEGTDDDYLAQIMDYNEQAAHDDAPDSAACVCRALDRGQLTIL